MNLSEIRPYIDYLLEQQGVKSIFGKSFLLSYLSCARSLQCYHIPTKFMHSCVLCLSFSQTPPSVNGTTGEGMSLTVEERKLLAEEWCRKSKLEQVMVHVGCMSLKYSQELEVASASPAVPLYYYHIPAVTGVNLLSRDVLEGIEKQIPSFQGLKFSDLMDFGQCVSYSPSHWSLLYSIDEQLLGALAIGANGAVGSTYNYLGGGVNRLLSSFDKGYLPKARTLQFQVQDILCYAIKLGFDLAVNKQLMS
ncbi:unnamed protein product, partial [Coregonus sp. 'balchen']